MQSDRRGSENRSVAAFNLNDAWTLDDSSAIEESAQREKNVQESLLQQQVYPFQQDESADQSTLTRTFFDQPLRANDLRGDGLVGDDSTHRMHVARRTAHNEMLNGTSSAILPTTTRPRDAAFVGLDDDFDGSANLGLQTKVKKGLMKDRLGRTMCLYESPMPSAQKDYGVKDHSDKLKMASGQFATRAKQKREVEEELNGPNRENDSRTFAATQAATADAATRGDMSLNSKHMQ